MNAAFVTTAIFAIVATWSVLFRLPFRDPGRRQRVALQLGDRFGAPPKAAFSVFGTVEYVALAAVVIAAVRLLPVDGVPNYLRFAQPSGDHFPIRMALAVFGAFSLSGLATSLLVLVDPKVDFAKEVASLRWIESASALGRWKWTVPLVGAAFEELTFRGVVLPVTIAATTPMIGVLLTGGAFALQQSLLVETRNQVWILASSALIISFIGGVLCVLSASMLPGLLLHLSFVAFFSVERN
jgi:hypothetical protein